MRNNLLSLVRDRQYDRVTTVDYSARDTDGIVEPPNRSLYVREVCPTIVPRIDQSIAVKQSLE